MLKASALPLLIRASLADSHFRVMRAICKEDTEYPMQRWGQTAEHRLDRNHPYLRACDEARNLCEELGSFCLARGLDPRESALLQGLFFRPHFEAKFEAGREVLCVELSPAVIHSAVEKGNVLRWNDWVVSSGEPDFSTDTYGLDQHIRPLLAASPGGAFELWMAGEPKARAREAYRLLTGEVFTGSDGLGQDEPNILEVGVY